MPARYCFALDLKEDAALIAEYDAWHQRVWPDIVKSIRDAGIESMEIYRVHNRLFMIMETNESFSFETKDARDKASTTVQAWETLMWRYQQALPFAKPGEKWVRMDKIFTLGNS
jgi:L-rhamnose mutarotase